MAYAWKLVLLPALLTLVNAEHPVDFEESFTKNNEPDSYRLPEDLDPVHYDIEITPYFEVEGEKEAFTFDGRVSITVKVSTHHFLTIYVLLKTVRTTKKKVPFRDFKEQILFRLSKKG